MYCKSSFVLQRRLLAFVAHLESTTTMSLHPARSSLSFGGWLGCCSTFIACTCEKIVAELFSHVGALAIFLVNVRVPETLVVPGLPRGVGFIEGIVLPQHLERILLAWSLHPSPSYLCPSRSFWFMIQNRLHFVLPDIFGCKSLCFSHVVELVKITAL